MANLNINKVILGGRLTADPELRMTPSGVAVTSFKLAITRPGRGQDGERQSDFIDVTAWRSTAEFITRYFKKGSSLWIWGHIETRSWVDKSGVKRYGIEVEAEEAHFVDSKGEGQSAAALEPAPQFEDVPDGELPF